MRDIKKDFASLSEPQFIEHIQNCDYGSIFLVVNDEHEDLAAWCEVSHLKKWELLDLAFEFAVCDIDGCPIILDGYDCIVDSEFIDALDNKIRF